MMPIAAAHRGLYNSQWIRSDYGESMAGVQVCCTRRIVTVLGDVQMLTSEWLDVVA